MADGKDLAGVTRQRHQFGGFFAGGGDGLFDQHMGAGLEEIAHDLGMGDGRRADADQIDLAQQFTPVRDGGAAMMGLGLGAHLGIGVGDGKQGNVFAALAQRLVFGGVVMPEDPCAHDSSFQRSTFRHAAAEKQDVEFPNN